jgi:hypothetical protein
MQVKEGALLVIEGSGHKYAKAILDTLPDESFERCYHLQVSLYPVGGYTLCSIQPAALRKYISSVCGELDARAREACEECVYA